MADPFSVVTASLGLVGVVTACVDCFGYVQIARNFGRDFTTCQVKLVFLQARLARWKASVRLGNEPQPGSPIATTKDMDAVYKAMHQILTLLHISCEKYHKYRPGGKPPADTEVFSTADLDSAVQSMCQEMEAVSLQRQTQPSKLKIGKWAIFDAKDFQHLVTDITDILDELEKAYPPPPPPPGQPTLQMQDLERFGNELQLKTIADVTRLIDANLHRGAVEALARQGHQYRNINIRGMGMNGDIILDPRLTGSTAGPSHLYENIDVDQRGRVLNGNQYGGKGFFDNRG